MKKNFLFYLLGVFFFIANSTPVRAYGECTEFGYGAMYDYLSDTCKCMSGYAFSDDMFGNTKCVSLDSICSDKLGYNSRYNSLYDRCECRLGYVIDGGRCTDGDMVCHSEHGYNSDYDSLSNKCECDDGYTFDDSGRCVEKQNNVYFTLKELDTSEKKAIIRGDYDRRYYLVTYGLGCYSSSFRRYLNNQIVINLGTDFDLDVWDKIVLQDDNEVCDIRRVERVDSETTLVPEEVEEDPVFVVPTPILLQKNEAQPVVVTEPQQDSKEIPDEFRMDESKKRVLNARGVLNRTGNVRKCPSTKCGIEKSLSINTDVQIVGGYGDMEWYEIKKSDVSGWIVSSLVSILKEDAVPKIEQSSTSTYPTTVDKPQAPVSTTVSIPVQNQPQDSPKQKIVWFKRLFSFFFSLLKPAGH